MPLSENELKYILSICDEADRSSFPSSDLIVKVKVSRYGRETYRMWPGGPVGVIIDEVPPYIVVAYNKQNVREWAARRLRALQKEG